METISLRELCEKDLSAINRWRNDRETIGMLGAPFRFINLATDEAWLADYQKSRGSQVRCSVFVRGETTSRLAS